MTRRQMLMAQALRHVQAIGEDQITREVYGGLCHKLPVLIQTNGLCETVAFLAAKASGQGPQSRAYALICDHLAATLGRDRAALVGYITAARLDEYMLATRTALVAWSFYKRFAVSVLGVEAADAVEAPE